MMKATAPMVEEVNEASSLLSPPGEHVEAFEHRRPARAKWHTSRTVVNLIMAMVLIASFGDRLIEPPQTRISEAVICYNYFEKVDPRKILLDRNHVGPGAIGGVLELDCKVDDVQNTLASLGGWAILFDSLPTLLLAMPYGWVADRFGRKPVLFMGLCAMTVKVGWIQIVTWFWQTFDIRLIWLGSLPSVFGGGSMVFSTLTFVALSDVTPEAERAAVFLRVSAFNLVAGLLMPPIAAWLMKINPWIPSLLGTILFFLATVLFAFVPETLGYLHPVKTQHLILVEEESGLADIPPKHQSPWRNYASRQVACIRTTMSFLTDDWRVCVLLLPPLGNFIVGIIGPLFLQYLSKHYSIPLSTATLLLLIRSAVVTVLLFVLLPLASNLLMRYFHFSGQRKDLYLARGSQLIMGVGCILVGLAPNIALVSVGIFITALGQGASPLIRAFMITLIPANRIARTFSVLGLLESLGGMVGAPLMASFFKAGMRMGGMWIGLPFVVLGIVTVLLALLLFVVNIRPGEDELHLAQEEQERREL